MGVELREARVGDEAAVADIHVRAWQEAYRRLIPDEFLDALDPEDRARTYTFESDDPDAPTTLLAVQTGEDCGEIIAFIAKLPPHVCINELTVSPTWNRGFVAQAKALTR